jgi:hypothetical protein
VTKQYVVAPSHWLWLLVVNKHLLSKPNRESASMFEAYELHLECPLFRLMMAAVNGAWKTGFSSPSCARTDSLRSSGRSFAGIAPRAQNFFTVSGELPIGHREDSFLLEPFVQIVLVKPFVLNQKV